MRRKTIKDILSLAQYFVLFNNAQDAIFEIVCLIFLKQLCLLKLTMIIPSIPIVGHHIVLYLLNLWLILYHYIITSANT